MLILSHPQLLAALHAAAGTDVLEGDPLGRLAVSEEGVVRRDEMVWRFAAERVGAPIVMTLSGGKLGRRTKNRDLVLQASS